MKKLYIAPMMETEKFETSDVITISMTFSAGKVYDTAADVDGGIPTVVVGEDVTLE